SLTIAEAEAALTAAPSETEPSSIPQSRPSSASPSTLRFAWVIAAVGLGSLLFAAGWMLAGLRTSKQENAAAISAELQELWAPCLTLKEGVSVCFSNPLTAVVKRFETPLSPTSLPPRVLLSREQEELYRATVPLPAGGYLYLAPAVSQAKMGEAFAAVALAS